MRLKKLSRFSIILTLILSVSVSCSSKETQELLPSTTIQPTAGLYQETDDEYTIQANFDLFTDKIFREQVLSDSITLNYTLANPENYGITNFSPTFGDYSVTHKKEAIKKNEDYYRELLSFDELKLTQQQQITYKILTYLLTPDLSAEDFILYDEILSPTTGMQAQLPVLLAEYTFYDKDDVTNYLTLLNKLPDYFSQIITFEQEKSKAGLFMSDVAVDDILNQCKQFTKEKENNYLIDIFNTKLDSFDYTAKEKEDLISKNKEAILNSVLPAYETLMNGLQKLKGTGINTGGLAHYPKGKEYYKQLVATTTGSSKSIEQIDSLLTNTINTCMGYIYSMALLDTNIITEADTATYPMTEPKEILNYLKQAVTTDFPSLDRVNCTIKYVHPSLQESLSPAFYLTPPIDNYSQNNIYINSSEKYDLSEIFTTIAHEGYPGHLYQTVYYHQKNPSLIRSILDFGGYSEGWATYVEMYSYGLSGLNSNVANLLKQNHIAILCIYAKLDIGVNYKGWSYDDAKTFLAQYSITDQDSILSMYQSMIEEPANYMKYTLGYLEIEALRAKAEAALGDAFILKDFHQFFLDMGPAPFDTIDEYLTQWIDKQLTK